MTKRIVLVAVMLICLKTVQGQKVSYVKLKNLHESATIIFDLDSISFHFNPTTVVAYLKGYKGHGQYLRPSIQALIKALDSSRGNKFTIKYALAFTSDGSLDTTSTKAK